MRSGLVPSLSALLVLACFAPRAASQLTLFLPLPVQTRQGEPTAAPKISHVQVRPAIHFPSSTYPTERLSSVRRIVITLPPGKPQGGTIRVLPSEGATQSCCAHIVIFRPPPDLDTKIVLPIPKNFISVMPTLPGLPPCLRDFRGMLIPRFLTQLGDAAKPLEPVKP